LHGEDALTFLARSLLVLVFAGDNEGYFNAFDSRTGKKLWSYRTGSLIWGAAPTTVMLDGKQVVMLPSGNTLVAFGLQEP